MNRRTFVSGSIALGMSATASMGATAQIGLIFAGLSTCPYCEQLARILDPLRFQGMEVLYASMDLKPLYPFMQFENGLAHPLTADFRSVPTILVVNMRLGDVTHQIDGFRNPRHFVKRLTVAIQQSATL